MQLVCCSASSPPPPSSCSSAGSTGLGDAKLMAMLAAWLGLPGALLAFGLGVVLGVLVAIVLLILPAARSQSGKIALTRLPLGTFLCIGGIVSSLWGERLIAFYLHWAGI